MANGDEEEEAAPKVEVGVEPSDRFTPNAGAIPNRGAFDVTLLLLLPVAPPEGWKLNENGEAVVGWAVLAGHAECELGCKNRKQNIQIYMYMYV